MDIYEKAWSGEHGKEYVERCNVDPDSRVDIFSKLFSKIIDKDNGPLEFFVLEVGCNKGHNLDAMAMAYDRDFNSDMAIGTNDIYKGIEINKDLCDRHDIINSSIYDLPWSNNVFDLVFSSGVLIHIPTDRLYRAMDQMRTMSRKWVMMIEYPADEEKGTKYGKDFDYQEGVWARPYGDFYQAYFPDDKLITEGKISDLGDDGWGFSKCNYWIYEKVSDQ